MANEPGREITTESSSEYGAAKSAEANVDGVIMLLRRIITILGSILILPVVTLCVIMVIYVVLLIQPTPIAPGAVDKIHDLISTIWDRLVPIGTEIIRVLSPMLVLILGIAALNVLNRDGQRAMRFGEILSDLPSVLAIMIVVAICLLPFTGHEVPEVLNNVALVVVGFYFGRGRQRGGADGGIVSPEDAS